MHHLPMPSRTVPYTGQSGVHVLPAELTPQSAPARCRDAPAVGQGGAAFVRGKGQGRAVYGQTEERRWVSYWQGGTLNVCPLPATSGS
eukprot:gene12435-biopygen3042